MKNVCFRIPVRLLACFLAYSLAFVFSGLFLSCKSSNTEVNSSNAVATSRAKSTESNQNAIESTTTPDAAGGNGIAKETSPSSKSETLPISWSFSPAQYRGKNGQQFTFNCPANGKASTVYGTDVYTDDSSICTAAVHQGLIKLESGGIVTIEIRNGQDAYIGSERNGITTSDFNNHWLGSFAFVKSSS